MAETEMYAFKDGWNAALRNAREVKALVETLEYYEYPGRNLCAQYNNPAGVPGGTTESERDNGKRAREALASYRRSVGEKE